MRGHVAPVASPDKTEGLKMVTREKLTQAVSLAICLERGYYLGTVARDKQIALDELKAVMDSEQLVELGNRVK